MSQPKTIFLVDDDAQVRGAFNRALTREGFRVVECAGGPEALRQLEHETPAVVILDVDMPGMDGWKTLAEIRKRTGGPLVLMVTHVNDVPARVQGLEAGADDYLGKPCEAAELLARVRALLRRAPPAASAPATLRFGDLVVDLERKTALRGRTPVRLTRTEFALLDLFRRHAGKPVSREAMLEHLWGARSETSHTIDTHLWRLRKKLGGGGRDSPWIENIPGIGYVLTSETDPAA